MATVSPRSLLIRCGVAAAIYYLPQDMGVLALLAMNKRSNSKQIAGSITSGPSTGQVDRIIKNYMMDKGFNSSKYLINKGRRYITVELA
ncbi:putative integral membrane protein [Babesia bovis T2Bo]|uniref:Uncharacterized protein n=1 Tax=Babesia bovis TaxID=5865 RepID=A7ARG9_BABBO|nr:putative integral membrane protein [Babesia bovis T2Bo]EDO07138.1 putative integral membrane protein [Babesia bovis T2Bo]|eukprot:XP_001610706.1 hypothetical protein [Babesia bovis T2Bo]